MKKKIFLMMGVLLGFIVLTVQLSAFSANSKLLMINVDQYMAVCTETQEHGGQEYVLTSWHESRDYVNEAGKTHEQRTKGHRWAIRTRQKP